MPFGDDILKIDSYSLTDFHDFDECSFRFYIRHHLDKKYEIDEGNPKLALGNLLDQTIKLFHKFNFYHAPIEQLPFLVVRAKNHIIEYEKKRKQPNFYTNTVPFLDDLVVKRAQDIFLNFYKVANGKIRKAIDPLGFCEWVIDSERGKFKLWGGADVIEEGEDGVPEVVDYKSRENFNKRSFSANKRGFSANKEKLVLDMDLMPKIYILLVSDKLLKKGYKRARFRVRFWQEPREDSYFEDFDLESIKEMEKIFKDKIYEILDCKEIHFCNISFCTACKSERREEFLLELKKRFDLNVEIA